MIDVKPMKNVKIEMKWNEVISLEMDGNEGQTNSDPIFSKNNVPSHSRFVWERKRTNEKISFYEGRTEVQWTRAIFYHMY